jgi:hypothetical protein
MSSMSSDHCLDEYLGEGEGGGVGHILPGRPAPGLRHGAQQLHRVEQSTNASSYIDMEHSSCQYVGTTFSRPVFSEVAPKIKDQPVVTSLRYGLYEAVIKGIDL